MSKQRTLAIFFKPSAAVVLQNLPSHHLPGNDGNEDVNVREVDENGWTSTDLDDIEGLEDSDVEERLNRKRRSAVASTMKMLYIVIN